MPDPHELSPRLREYLKKRLSPAEYASYVEHREKSMDRHVEKVIEDFERNAEAADLALHVELHQETLKEELKEKEFTDIVELPQKLQEKLPALQQAFAEGKFHLDVQPTGDEHAHLTVSVQLPEGNVQEALPVKPQLQKTILARARGA